MDSQEQQTLRYLWQTLASFTGDGSGTWGLLRKASKQRAVEIPQGKAVQCGSERHGLWSWMGPGQGHSSGQVRLGSGHMPNLFFILETEITSADPLHPGCCEDGVRSHRGPRPGSQETLARGGLEGNQSVFFFF